MALGVVVVCAAMIVSVVSAPVRAGGRAEASSVDDGTVAVSASSAQVMQGFGASGAWWPNDLQHFPAGVQKQVGDLLFSDKGLELSGYRYNIGGGGAGVSYPTHVAETFLVRPGVYDWSRDPGGVHFLDLARDHDVPVLTGFVNSAPSEWTTDALNCAGRLAPGSEGQYAKYLADVVRHLRVSDGITLSYVSPMNEPDSSFSHCKQEGMAVPPAQRADVVSALGSALAVEAPWARVIADESSKAFLQFLPEAHLWLSSPAASKSVAVLGHHTYDYPSDAMLSAVALVGLRYGKPTWTTEICCYDGSDFGSRYDPTMSSGMWLADSIWQDLSVTGDSAFYWWTALSKRIGCDPSVASACAGQKNATGWNDGLLYYDPNYARDKNFDIYATKRFWVMANFSRFVRPSATRHAVAFQPPHVRLLAFKNGAGWTVVAVDQAPPTNSNADVRIAFPEGSRSLTAEGAFRTSASLNLGRVPLPTEDHGVFATNLEPQSVTTYVFGQRADLQSHVTHKTYSQEARSSGRTTAALAASIWEKRMSQRGRS